MLKEMDTKLGHCFSLLHLNILFSHVFHHSSRVCGLIMSLGYGQCGVCMFYDSVCFKPRCPTSSYKCAGSIDCSKYNVLY